MRSDWWHRDHPTFTALSGFLAGLALVILVPGLVVVVRPGLLDHAAGLVLLFLVLLMVPVALAAVPRTRRLALYVALGMVVTVVVVAVVAAVVLWFLVQHDG
jgi:hypothetical protein